MSNLNKSDFGKYLEIAKLNARTELIKAKNRQLATPNTVETGVLNARAELIRAENEQLLIKYMLRSEPFDATPNAVETGGLDHSPRGNSIQCTDTGTDSDQTVLQDCIRGINTDKMMKQNEDDEESGVYSNIEEQSITWGPIRQCTEM
ncbi:hypothetical protein LOTGIDRAFT_229259 [Lottia gigantea]|uniref:Uncharacterized protein n=1 Tax=Lottia gigantea TaxID=225164 RepID=V3ZRW8_LOTGI|nr:hypothetical protein LOTGIDRAFT_229259 [Lottia gigantea]ESO87092.1 hypothetical protein LOTGIDRAFT_229259 [Lottia gigantea]